MQQSRGDGKHEDEHDIRLTRYRSLHPRKTPNYYLYHAEPACKSPRPSKKNTNLSARLLSHMDTYKHPQNIFSIIPIIPTIIHLPPSFLATVYVPEAHATSCLETQKRGSHENSASRLIEIEIELEIESMRLRCQLSFLSPSPSPSPSWSCFFIT